MRNDLASCRLYGIIDLGYVRDEEATAVAEKMLAGGIDLIQLRGKSRRIAELTRIGQQLVSLTQKARIPFIINDHAEILSQTAADGVHVGQDDDAIAHVRAQVKRPIVVGKSTHSLAQAVAAEKEGADYIGFGPIFATPTKPDYLPIGLDLIRQVHAQVSIPIFCIGGINIDNLQQVIDAGAKRVVMVSAILRAHNIVDYVRCGTDMLA